MKVEYPEDIIIPADRPEVITPYLEAYRSAWNTRFPKATFAPVSSVVTESPFVAAAAPAACAKKYRKRAAMIAIAMVFALVAVAVAVLSYLALLGDFDKYTVIFSGTTVKNFVDTLMDGTTATAIKDIILFYAVPVAFLAGILFALVTVIVGIAALASKKRVLVFVTALIALIFGLASGGVFFYKEFSKAGFDLVKFINPLEDTGIVFGYCIALAAQLISFIFSCFCYKKLCK